VCGFVVVEDQERDSCGARGGNVVRSRLNEFPGCALPAVYGINPQRAEEGLCCRGQRLLDNRDDTDRRGCGCVMESQQPEVAAQALTPPPLVVAGLVTVVRRERVWCVLQRPQPDRSQQSPVVLGDVMYGGHVEPSCRDRP
jgi:hypothetical protein